MLENGQQLTHQMVGQLIPALFQDLDSLICFGRRGYRARHTFLELREN
eukprot:SAG31_NODE_39806_length_285_cov_0.913978_1_plen_47_part_10